MEPEGQLQTVPSAWGGNIPQNPKTVVESSSWARYSLTRRSGPSVPLRHRQHSGCRAQLKDTSGVELTDMLHQCSCSAGAQHGGRLGLLQKMRRGNTLRVVFAGVSVET